MHSNNNSNATHDALSIQLDELLAAAQPRLFSIAQRQGVTPDGLDDVVQETLVEAWRHLEHIRNPNSFDAWLNGICRNVSMRWHRTHAIATHRQVSFSSLIESQDESECDELDIVDSLAVDPAEEVQQQDLEILLDRAMSYLPATTRQALELHYITGKSQNETALQLGMTINALEVRLHRARRQLREVLSNQLREDARSFGMIPDNDAGQGWRDTSLWCMFCGMHHLQGLLETLHDGRVGLRLRCPGCEQFGGREWIVSGGLPNLCGMKSFRPAFQRSMHITASYWTNALYSQRCASCNAPITVRLLEPNEAFFMLRPWQGLRLAVYCVACDSLYSCYVSGLAWFHPVVQSFMKQHPRWINEPEMLTNYSNQPAFRIRFADAVSTARLTVWIHQGTLQVLATCEE